MGKPNKNKNKDGETSKARGKESWKAFVADLDEQKSQLEGNSEPENREDRALITLPTAYSSSPGSSRTLGDNDTLDVGGEQQLSDTKEEEEISDADKVTDKMPEPIPEGKKEEAGRGKVNKPSWVKAVGGNRATAAGIQLRTIPSMQGNAVFMPNSAVKNVDDIWGFCLLGYFSGIHPGMTALLELCESWNVQYKLHHHKSGWIVFKFKTEEMRQLVLQGGPYSIYSRHLHLKPVPLHFKFDPADMAVVPVWTKLIDWPLELWDEEPISRFASGIGTPMATDVMTKTRGGVNYVRVLIHIDISKPLREIIPIVYEDGFVIEQKVEYEWVPMYCSQCKNMTHQTAECRVLKKLARAKEGEKVPEGNQRVTKVQPVTNVGKEIRKLPNIEITDKGTHIYFEEAKEDDQETDLDLEKIAEAFIGTGKNKKEGSKCECVSECTGHSTSSETHPQDDQPNQLVDKGKETAKTGYEEGTEGFTTVYKQHKLKKQPSSQRNNSPQLTNRFVGPSEGNQEIRRHDNTVESRSNTRDQDNRKMDQRSSNVRKALCLPSTQ